MKAKVKTKKALQKRFSVTKKGKVVQRHAGQDHFNSRDSGKITRKKRRDHKHSESNTKTIKKYIK